MVAHESDLTQGLLIVWQHHKTFAPVLQIRVWGIFVAVKHTGTPIRPSCGWRRCQGAQYLVLGNKEILLVTGGSLGADKLNQVVRELPELLQQYTVVHICGPGKVSGKAQPGY